MIAAIALTSMAACSSNEKTDSGVSVDTGTTRDSVNILPDSDPGIRGVITKADSTAGSRYILVEENPADMAGSQKASVRLTDQAKIYRRSGQGIEKINREDLASGNKVSVWFEGPVAESYPVQGTAAVVVLED